MGIEIPDEVKLVLYRLHSAGFGAYAVGGCIRDALLEKIPEDWDICTSAVPPEICSCFPELRRVEIGKAYGTVTVFSGNRPVEITTYRTEEGYRDGRHPERVKFTSKLKEDLRRRDFTMNTLAYNPREGILDFFDGREAIREKKIIAVGNPETRFLEDGLRILRALRFSAVLGFSIETRTGRALRSAAPGLGRISRERVNRELCRFIMGEYADDVLQEYGDILEKEFEGFRCAPLNHLPEVVSSRLAALFPEDTEQHLRQLHLDRETCRQAAQLAKIRQEELPEDEAGMARLVHRYGKGAVRLYFEEKNRQEQLEAFLAEEPCCNIGSLEVSGRDLLDAGILPGPEIGRTLSFLLEEVMEKRVENRRESLLIHALKRKEKSE